MIEQRLAAGPNPSQAVSASGPSRVRNWPAALFFFALWGVLCCFLGAEWTINEQYNYGWFVPFLAAYLFWTRWENRPPSIPVLPDRRRALLFSIGVAALIFLFPIRLFELGNPDWRLLGWLHAFVAADVTFIALWMRGGKRWMHHFAFPIAFFFVAVPWLLIFETPLVQGLMRIVAMGASEGATLCGIPAEFEGNLIRVNAGVVGVNEACSGVRSLQTSLMIGLLFGDLLRLSTARRVWLVCGALAIALAANFARAFFLVWIAADQGLGAVDRWHDFAGYFILGAVFLGSALLAALLTRRQRKSAVSPREITSDSATAPPDPRRPFFVSRAVVIGAFAWLVLVEIGVEVWYRVHERNFASQTPWIIQWPSSVPVKTIAIDERVRRILRFNDGRSAEWPIALPNQSPGRALAFFFRWSSGSTSVTRARAHRPDICLPSSGWQLKADHGLRYYKAAENFSLPFRHFGFVREEEGKSVAFGQAFFCINEDSIRRQTSGARSDEAATMEVTRWMLAERAKVVWEGLRNPGQQVFELIVISRQEIPATAAETRFAEILPSLVRMGENDSAASTTR